jgi:hypothetical protein
MKNPSKQKRTDKCISVIYNGIDSHKWASKVEIQHLISSKPALKVVEKPGQDHIGIN